MSVKTKTQLKADIDSKIVAVVTVANLNSLLKDMVDSADDVVQSMNSDQRDVLTPFAGQKIFNTTTNRLEIYGNTQWLPASSRETVEQDCSGSPNYPAGLIGDLYLVSVSGKIGGSTGKPVYAGDFIYCIAQNAGGNEATVGTSWQVSRIANTLSSTPKWLKVGTVTYSAVSTAATSNDISIYTLPSRGYVHDSKIVATTPFSGGSVTGAVANVGPVGALEKFVSAVDVFGADDSQSTYRGYISLIGTTNIHAQVISEGANLSDLTAGSFDVYLLLSQLP